MVGYEVFPPKVYTVGVWFLAVGTILGGYGNFRRWILAGGNGFLW
jgi:hypothetical protein